MFCRASLGRYLDPDEILEVTKQGFAFFEEQYGRPYPFVKYDQLFVPEFNAGAMENAGCVTFLEDMGFRSKVTDASRDARANTIRTEMAHMWFGDLVTMRWWDDLWLNGRAIQSNLTIEHCRDRRRSLQRLAPRKLGPLSSSA